MVVSVLIDNSRDSARGDVSDFFEVPKWTPRRRRPEAEGPPTAGRPALPLVTYRNNSNTASGPSVSRGPWGPQRAYVGACCLGTLALHYADGRITWAALTCKSWACPHCRKQRAASTLDGARLGMESRSDWNRYLTTFTFDPEPFGGVCIGWKTWEDGRKTRLWAPPTPEQFAAAILAGSREWNRFVSRMSVKARRSEQLKAEFLRNVELHRNAWPHYHAVIEHPEWSREEVEQLASGWKLGRVDISEGSVSIDDAVGEVAPYLVSAEKKSNGTKAYQFAGYALPKGFRLVQPSRGFMGSKPDDIEREKPDHAVTLRGHFSSYHEGLREMGAEPRLLLYPPSEGDYRPPGRTLTTGDAAVVYYAELVAQKALHSQGGL